MYKNFYIAKSLINILLIGLLCFFMFFDEIQYLIIVLILVMLSQLIFSFIKKFKFAYEAFKQKSNKILQILMILALWAGMYFSRLFIIAAWIIYLIIEVLMYNDAKDYFE